MPCAFYSNENNSYDLSLLQQCMNINDGSTLTALNVETEHFLKQLLMISIYLKIGMFVEQLVSPVYNTLGSVFDMNVLLILMQKSHYQEAVAV
ncbi:hypothetical protein QVD17_13706 [Tagetes erecta]|uniref:Uncharacterized protein n=1 Tax=Tagetes erecta TaxID=13708 RepID=A0AAD8P3F3_TARER|nr:hypothetical protein QVD17_13706 [Tagetes erecta]